MKRSINLNNLDISNVTSEKHQYYALQTTMEHEKMDSPAFLTGAMYDTGASLIALRLEVFQKLLGQNHYTALSKSDVQIIQGDGSAMNCLGYTFFKSLSFKDSDGYIFDAGPQQVYIFKSLNYEMIIGRNALRNASKIIEYPSSNSIQINPSAKRIRSGEKKYITHFRNNYKNNNNISSSCTNGFSGSNNNAENFSNSSSNSSTNNSVLKTDTSSIFSKRVKKLEEILSLHHDGTRNNYTVSGTKARDHNMDSSNKPAQYGVFVIEEEDIDFCPIADDEPVKFLSTNKGKVKVRASLPDNLCELFTEYINDFKGKLFDTGTIGSTPEFSAIIKLKPGLTPEDAPPVRFIPLSDNYKAEMKSLLSKMVAKNVLRKSNKKANCALFLVEKTQGGFRLIADLKGLNRVIDDYVTHLTPVDEVLQRLSKFDVFAYLDWSDAYFSLPIDLEKSDIDIVASVAGSIENWQFLKIPQGMKTSTGLFVDCVHQIYKDFLEWCAIYLDDSGIGATTDEQLFQRIKLFLERSEKHDLRIKLSKCAFFMNKITFLNFNISKNKIGLSTHHKTAIRNLQIPQVFNDKVRESMAGFLNYFSRFSLLSKYCRIIRTGSRAQAVHALKKCKHLLLNVVPLTTVNFKDDLHIFVDSSENQAAACIFQGSNKKRLDLVTCWSTMLPKQYKDRPIYEKEMWVLAKAAMNKQWRYLLYGNHKKYFYCDNRSVVSATQARAPTIRSFFATVESTLKNVEYVWIESAKNPVDVFTRFSEQQKKVKTITRPCTKQDKQKEVCATTRRSAITKELVESYVKAPTLEKLQRIHEHANHMPRSHMIKILEKLNFKGPEIESLVNQVFANCKTCQLPINKPKPRKQAPGITKTSQACDDCIFIDHKKIKTKSRESKTLDFDDNGIQLDTDNWDKTEVLTIFEPLSRSIHIFPTSSYDLEESKRALRFYFNCNGPTKHVVCDNYKTFEPLKPWLKEQYNTDLHHTSVYHPESNLSEFYHRYFNAALDRYDAFTKEFGFENWEDTLNRFCVMTNSVGAQDQKYSPFEITRNRKIINLYPTTFKQTDIEKEVHENQLAAKISKILKSKLKVKNRVFKHGEQVKVQFRNKEARMAEIHDPNSNDGPFKTTAKVVFEEQRQQKPITVNKNFLCLMHT